MVKNSKIDLPGTTQESVSGPAANKGACAFNYKKAFIRNLGLVTPREQEKIGQAKIGIPGLGGVGGEAMITFARMGFQHFHVADVDGFEMANFNRQYGANVSTLGRHKVDVMRELARQINPNLSVKGFRSGITRESVDAFLDGLDLVIDSIELYEMHLRREIINRALQKGTPVISAGPIGMGTCFLTFLPGGPDFDEFVGVNEGTDALECMLRFLTRISPHMVHKDYVLTEFCNVAEKQLPTLSIGVKLAAGVAGGEALKIILGRGQIDAVPYTRQFDVYTNSFVTLDRSRPADFSDAARREEILAEEFRALTQVFAPAL